MGVVGKGGNGIGLSKQRYNTKERAKVVREGARGHE